MPGVPPITFELADFKDPAKFQAVNDWFAHVANEINRQAGVHGPIEVFAPINMRGNAVTNVGAPTGSNDALTPAAASSSFGAGAIQKALEATGNNILQTTRRLNDNQQRELSSSFLNQILNVPPGTNTSQVTIVNNGNGTSTVTIAAGTYKFADHSVVPYAQRSDTFTNPGAGSNTYYYYLRKTDNTLQFVGPFTSATSSNAFGAYIDQRGFVAKVTINAGGGGTGGGGGDPGGGGCLEVGTSLVFFPGSNPEITVEPCSKWVAIFLKDGRVIRAAPNTRIAIYKRVQDLDFGDLTCDIDGEFTAVVKIEAVEFDGFKMKVRVKGGRYIGAGVEFHNFKPNN